MPGARWRSKLSWNQVRYASVSFYLYICKFPANILHFCKHECHIDVSMKPQIFFQTWLDGHLCTVFVKIKSALTSVPTFACLQKLALHDASQHWTFNFMFIARGWVLNSLQGEYWKILSLGIGLANTPLLAGMDTKSIPVEWDGLTVLKSILPW